MCGILGWIDDGALQRRGEFEAALDLLTHRGPDDRGVLAEPPALLGHRRLSILDLSPAGRQPMVDPESGAAIVFNGEIFNYIELRGELAGAGHEFKSGTDTEVLLKAYLHWGPQCLSRLNGMWAFAVWVPREGRLFMARDRFGVKPFYYTEEGTFAFSSEPKSLLALFPHLRVVEPGTLYRFLAQGLLYTTDESFYQGIRLLPPASYAEFDAGTRRLRTVRYWDYPRRQAPASDPGTEAEEFGALFDDAVNIRLRSDVPVGVSLSGGLDSTAVLASAMKESNGTRVCFTSVYDAGNRGEAGWAVRAGEPYGIRPVEVEAPAHAWIDTLRRIAWHMDAPGYSPAVYALWFLMSEAQRRKVPVLLEGQGADEALGGYPQYGVLDLIEKLKALVTRPARGRLGAVTTTWRGLVGTFTARWVVRWLARESLPFLVTMHRRRVGALSALRPEFVRVAATGESTNHGEAPGCMDTLTQRLWLEHSRNILPGLLHYGDAVSMAHSIESRLPFLDYRLVEWLFSRSGDIKIRRGTTKWVLREYLRRAQQQAIAERRDKLGYPTPVDEWLAADGGAVPRDLLTSSDSAITEFCDPSKVRRLIDFHARGGQGAGNHLYRLVSTEIWLRNCVIPASGEAPTVARSRTGA